MDAILRKVFKSKTVVDEKLSAYGFQQKNGLSVYSQSICDGQMEVRITVDQNGRLDTEVMDLETQEPYTLYRIEDAGGSFVGRVRLEYQKILIDIADKCCVTEVFKSADAKRLIAYVRERYGDELEFLWEKFSENAIWRCKENRKWYAVLLRVPRRKIVSDSDEIIEVLDVRATPEQAEILVDNQKYFKGYHMNKKHWITVCLDGSVAFDEICARLDQSYLLAKER